MPIGIADVRDIQGIRLATANAHSSVYDALAQYVANSIRAYRELTQNNVMAPTNPPEVRIYLNRGRAKNHPLESIVISDDATGMTQEEIALMPKLKGRSEHIDDPGSNAFYNLGHDSFIYFAETCLYQTKHFKQHLGRHELSSLRLLKETADFVYNEHLDGGLENRLSHGTDVTITNIASNYHHRLIPRFIEQYMASKFRGLIGRRINIKIIGKVGNKESDPIMVQNKPYKGVEIVSHTYRNINGLQPVTAVIYYNPNSKSKSDVALLHYGEEYGLVTGSAFDSNDEWNIPGLEGHITFDNGKPRPDKNGFIYPDKKADIFYTKVILPLKHIVLKETEQLKAKHEAIKHEQIYHKVNDALAHSIEDLGIIVFPHSRKGGRRRGFQQTGLYMDPEEIREQMKRHELTVTDMDELFGKDEFNFTTWFQHDGGQPVPYGAAEVMLDFFSNIKTGDHPWYNQGTKKEDPNPVGVPVPRAKNKKGAKRAGPVSKPDDDENEIGGASQPRLHFLEESLGDVMEYGDYNPEIGIVRINMDHPDYDSEVTNGSELQRTLYIAKVAALQLVNEQHSEFPARAQMNAMTKLTNDLERRLRAM